LLSKRRWHALKEEIACTRAVSFKSSIDVPFPTSIHVKMIDELNVFLATPGCSVNSHLSVVNSKAVHDSSR